MLIDMEHYGAFPIYNLEPQNMLNICTFQAKQHKYTFPIKITLGKDGSMQVSVQFIVVYLTLFVVN